MVGYCSCFIGESYDIITSNQWPPIDSPHRCVWGPGFLGWFFARIVALVPWNMRHLAGHLFTLWPINLEVENPRFMAGLPIKSDDFFLASGLVSERMCFVTSRRSFFIGHTASLARHQPCVPARPVRCSVSVFNVNRSPHNVVDHCLPLFCPFLIMIIGYWCFLSLTSIGLKIDTSCFLGREYGLLLIGDHHPQLV